MAVVKIKIYPWDSQPTPFLLEEDLKKGDKVLIETNFGTNLGEVVAVEEEDKEIKEDPSFCFLRKATPEDEKKYEEAQEGAAEAKEYCRQKARELGLNIKIVNALFSLKKDYIIFVFVAETRIDFRELVKDLVRHFQKPIRMQQIGIRDEAKMMGGIGVCGRELCCLKVLRSLANIRSDLIKLQQLENRASDRLSGVCGRLMCCLAYEQQMYAECSQGFPELGERVKYKGKNYEVIAQHTLKRTVSGKDKEGVVIEIPVDKIKR